MLERTPGKPPLIKPLLVPSRPLWSVMIPAYNCIKYLRTTLESVLLQDYGIENMQIEVVDDGSTDGNVEALVLEVGKGRVKYFRQETNKGSLRNFETCINRAVGKWVHILHGDDCVKPGYYKEIEKLFTAFPESGAAITRHSIMDEEGNETYESINIIDEFGIVDDWLFKIAQRQLLNPPAIVVKRSVYETLGSFYAVHYGEDWEMWARIGTRYKVAYSPVNLSLYRSHQNNISSKAFATGQNIKDINTVINIIQTYLPTDIKQKAKKQAQAYYAIYFAKLASKILHQQRNPKVALKQARGAFLMHMNKVTARTLVAVYGKSILNRY